MNKTTARTKTLYLKQTNNNRKMKRDQREAWGRSS